MRLESLAFVPVESSVPLRRLYLVLSQKSLMEKVILLSKHNWGGWGLTGDSQIFSKVSRSCWFGVTERGTCTPASEIEPDEVQRYERFVETKIEGDPHPLFSLRVLVCGKASESEGLLDISGQRGREPSGDDSHGEGS